MSADYSTTKAVTYMNKGEYQKEKAYNAITYFLQHTGTCYKKKTFKLLWLLDSEHYQMTGRSVTGYDYFAWKMGPVPTELNEQIESNDSELVDRFEIKREVNKTPKGDYEKIELISKRPFEAKYFSKKQLEIMRDLADRFDLATAQELEDYTHREGSPWHRVWHVEHRRQGQIPYEYALDSIPEPDKNTILSIAADREAFIANYQ